MDRSRSEMFQSTIKSCYSSDADALGVTDACIIISQNKEVTCSRNTCQSGECANTDTKEQRSYTPLPYSELRYFLRSATLTATHYDDDTRDRLIT